MQRFPWKTLIEWYKENGRHSLPWRNYDSIRDENILYHVWISEIFLQQTQVSRVIGYYEKVMERYPTIESLAATDYETFFPYYQGLGYYSRARNILKTAQIVKKEYNWKFPKNQTLLMKLPWVWPYTANAILAFGYGEAHLAWDTNLEKAFSRFYKGRKDIKLTIEERDEIEAGFHDFIRWMRNEELRMRNVRAINNALMDFSATQDLKNPEQIDWEKYPVKEGLFYETRWNLEPKEIKKSISFPTPDATIMVTLHKDHKIYYSYENPYQPFTLNPALHRDTRKYIQEYFRHTYWLELSVRPIHKKWFDEQGKPYVALNAQIQTGRHSFHEYSKKDYDFSIKQI